MTAFKKNIPAKLIIVFIIYQVNILFIIAQEVETDSIILPSLYEGDNLDFSNQSKKGLKLNPIKNKTFADKSLMIKEFILHETPPLPSKNSWAVYNNTYLHENIYYNYPKHSFFGENRAFYTNNRYDFMPGMSSINSISLGFKIQPTDNWYITLGNSASKYRDFSGIYNDFTIDASSYISLSDNFGINVYGSYSINAMNNTNIGAAPYSPFAPYSYYGGSIEFRITDKFGIEAGMMRQFNTWTRRWENMYYIAPKFYK